MSNCLVRTRAYKSFTFRSISTRPYNFPVRRHYAFFFLPSYYYYLKIIDVSVCRLIYDLDKQSNSIVRTIHTEIYTLSSTSNERENVTKPKPSRRSSSVVLRSTRKCETQCLSRVTDTDIMTSVLYFTGDAFQILCIPGDLHPRHDTILCNGDSFRVRVFVQNEPKQI